MSKACVTCGGATWVLAILSGEQVLQPCYTCQHTKRPRLPKPPPLFPLIPEQLQPMLRQAMAGTLGSLELAHGKLMPDAGAAALEYAASYAMGGNPECLERLEEIRLALEQTPPEPEKKPERIYDVSTQTFRPCRSCREPITFMATDYGRYTPVERDGRIHWPNCPDAKSWRKSA